MPLKAESISKTFIRNGKNTNSFYAVEETDLLLENGTVTAVIGRSGSGKTTLLNMLSGLLTPTSGKVFYDDEDVYSFDDDVRSKLRNKLVGVIPQGQTGLKSLTVYENVLLPAEMYGSVSEEIKERADELLKAVGIGSLKDEYPNELSGGELRRMAIARALVNKPSFVLADEPTGDLDDENTLAVLKLLRSVADQGAAVLIVTHEKDTLTFADKVYKMDAGKLSEVKKEE